MRDLDGRTDDDDDDKEPVYIRNCRCIHETAMAVLVAVDRGKGDEKFWVPKSVLHDDSEVCTAGDIGTLVVAGWFAEKEGLE